LEILVRVFMLLSPNDETRPARDGELSAPRPAGPGERTMTILLATKRDSFAILASESRPNNPSQGGDSKLVRHPSIPLAFGAGVMTGNLWWVPAPSQRPRPITAFLQEVVDEIDSPDKLVLSAIANRVRAKLQPGYAEMQRDAVIAIALFRDGKADIGFQQVGSRARLYVGNRPPFLRGPSSLLTSFYCPKFGPPRHELVHNSSLTDASKVVETVRKFVVDGIKYEQATLPTERRQCGEKVDVMLVDEAGARLV
jgi:hypothetical protein